MEEDDAWTATYQPEDDGVHVAVDEDGDQQPVNGVETTASRRRRGALTGIAFRERRERPLIVTWESVP
jgi:hypothetical protein